MWKLPSAYFCGVRVEHISETTCTTKVRHFWINQNPFKSIFWAVQGMAAELATGALVMHGIRESKREVSMLLVNVQGSFGKKATGKVTFTCQDGALFQTVLQKALQTGEGQTCIMSSKGIDQNGVEVSEFLFEWSIKIRA